VRVIKAGSKTLTTVYTTHAHPDHFVGIAVIKKEFPGARYVGLPEVVKRIASAWPARREFWYPTAGHPRRAGVVKLERQLSIWTYEAETAADFREAALVYARLRWKGTMIPTSDCLIAAVAKRCDFRVGVSDPHFSSIPGLKLFDFQE
jgi:hypothetical protein